MMKKMNKKVIEGFGDEWKRFNQSNIENTELHKLFLRYFNFFPWNKLPNN